eukprot:537126_1
MYSVEHTSIKVHELNWTCPQCNNTNDKSRFLCGFGECDYMHIPTEQYDDEICRIKYELFPTNVQRDLLLRGFIRIILKIKTHIPKDIISLIDRFFPLKISWDQNENRHGNNVKFTDHNVAQYYYDSTQSKHGYPAICISNYIIDSTDYDTFKWEIKLIQCGYPIYLGFIVCPLSNTMNWDTDTFGECGHKNQIGIYCYHDQQTLYKCQSIINLSTSARRKMMAPQMQVGGVIATGDIFRFEIDFINQTCYVYHRNKIIDTYNRKHLNIYPENKKDIQIIPAVLLCRGAKYRIAQVHD